MGVPTMDAAGVIYLVDNHRVRRIGADGVINTIAGNGQTGSSGDGGPALSASLTYGSIRQLAAYGSRVCFADAQALKIRCVDQITGLIQGYGTGVSGTGGDGGNVANASFMSPSGLAFDPAGNWYISDAEAHSVRRVDAVTGTVTMFAGPGPGYCCVPVGDGGPALGANLYQPRRLTVWNGALYIADTGNSRVRRVDLSTGIITTVAGGGNSTADGIPAASASINPGAVALDAAGNLFLSTSNRVRKVDTNGIIMTIAGIDGSGWGLDDIPATQTTFGGITGLVWDPFTNALLIGDYSVRLRQIFYTPATTTTLTLSPNPVVPNGQMTLQAMVSPQTATGSVRFYQDAVLSSTGAIMSATLLASVPMVNGAASATWTAPLTGSSSCTYQVCNLRAVYGGDAANNLSMSPDVVAMVQKGDTSTTFTSTPNPSAQGQNVTFTATVTPSNATGAFFVYNGATQIGSYPVVNGAATFTLSNLPAGSNALSARYSGSLSYNSSTGTLTQVVQPSTTTTLTSSANPSVYGSAVVLTAVVSPATATGAVQFYNGVALLGSGTLASGQAQLTTSSLPTGSAPLTAVYSGDTDHAGSTSAALVQTVSQASSSTTLAVDPATAIVGQTVTFTATIAPAAATGTVQFLDGAAVLGAAAISGGSASLATSVLSAGAHSVTAVYSGDANYSGSASAAAGVTVSKVSTTTSVAASPNPAAFGQNVMLTATVTPAAATGTVQFLDGTTVLGTATLSGGSAALGVSTLSAGGHSITAVYSGDSLHSGSASPALAVTVNKRPSSVTLVSSLNPAVAGQSVTFTATVAPTGATGAVQFLDGATALATVTVSGGAASFATAALPVGTHTITAVYTGDANTAGSTSTSISEVIKPVAPSNLTVANTSSSTINLTFTPSPTPGVTSYRIYGSSTPGVTTQSLLYAIVSGSPVSLKGFTSGVTTYFVITAWSPNGESLASNEVAATTKGKAH